MQQLFWRLLCGRRRERESREVNGRTERYGLERGEVKSVTGEGSGIGQERVGAARVLVGVILVFLQ